MFSLGAGPTTLSLSPYSTSVGTEICAAALRSQPKRVTMGKRFSPPRAPAGPHEAPTGSCDFKSDQISPAIDGSCWPGQNAPARLKPAAISEKLRSASENDGGGLASLGFGRSATEGDR